MAKPSLVQQSGQPAASAHNRALRRYRRSARWRVLEYCFWCLPVVAYFVFPTHYMLLTQIAITGLFALSLDLVFGYAGIISLGHAAFFGVGAYIAGILGTLGLGYPLLGLLLAFVGAAGVGFFSSFLLLRGNDLTKLMVTLGVALMLHALANQFSGITGGTDGLLGVRIKPILGLFTFDLFGRVGYIYAVVVLFVSFWLIRRLVHSPFGQSLRGINMNATRMPALGVPVNRRLITAYTIGAGFAGIAGALLAQTFQFVSLDVLGFQRSADVLVMLILGGAGHLYGGIIGGAVYMVMKFFLSGMNPQYWLFWIGLILVLVVLFARGGILGTAAKWVRLLQRRADRRRPDEDRP